MENPYINEKIVKNFENGFKDGDFLKGVIIGAALGYVLSNENAQKSLFKAFSKGANMLSMGVEELKERYEDMKASAE